MSKILDAATIRLAQILQTEPEESLNRLIAQVVVQQMPNIENLSTNDMARLCNISKTSFIRFCRHLGFETFADFKSAIIRNQSDFHQKYPSEINDLGVFSNDYFEFIKENICWLQTNLDLNLLQNMAQDLMTYTNVFLLGNAQSGNSANNLMFNLLQMRKLCHVATIHSEHRQIISHLKPNSMVIIISNYGSFFHTFVTPDCLKNKPENTVVYLLTCNENYPCPEGVDHVLLCGKDTGFSGGNLCIDMVLNLLLQYYRSLSKTPKNKQ